MPIEFDQEIKRPDRPEVVVITGATAGVGRAVAHAFARRGAHIGLLARGAERLEATRREVEQLGGRAIGIPTDVADARRVESAATAVEEAFGPIDTWVNNAMTSVFAEFIDIEPDEYQRVTDVCYHGTVNGTRAALKRMLPRDRGSIVLVGSALAYRGIPLQSAYCGAKHGVQGMFDSIRAELHHRDSRVHITMVQLPAVNTPQFSWVRSKLPNRSQPVPPIFQPEVAAKAVVWAAHHRRRELFVGWPSVKAIVGNKAAPAIADRVLGESGYEDQMLDEPAGDRPDNLFEPFPGDPGTHGAFDHRSKSSSVQLAISLKRRWIMLGALGLAAVLGSMAAARR